MPDQYTATWVSHSSLSDFRHCPRAYYLKNVYKSPETGRKIQIMAPALALGQAVHTVLESLSVKPVEERFTTSLVAQFADIWKNFTGEKGGFTAKSQENAFYARGEKMLETVMKNPGPLEKLAIKIKTDLPRYWLSEADEIILCGKIDWLEYEPEKDGVTIIDFKTGSGREDKESLQLSIYHLLVHNIQNRDVLGAEYWYLEQSPSPEPQVLPDLDEAHEAVFAQAKRLQTARKLEHFQCPEGKDGCRYCQPFERVLRGEAQHIGVVNRKDVYILADMSEQSMEFEAELL